MDDILKFLPVVAIILIGIFNAVKKSQAEKAETKRRMPSTPSAPEADSDASPMIGPWAKMLDELLMPRPVENPTMQPAAQDIPADSGKTKTKNKIKNKKNEVSVEASLANSVAQDARNLKDSSSHDDLAQLTDQGTEDFTINSVEEARRAIIWGEVLQRKY